MGDSLEVWEAGGRRAVALEVQRFTIGSDPSNDLVLDDPAVSALHCVLDSFPVGRSVRDLGSRNGTVVNGERISAEQALKAGDEIRVGTSRIILNGESEKPRRDTRALVEPPSLTRREMDVLTELCRPLLHGDAFTEPGSVRTIASALVITEAAVKQHIANLYDKFDLFGEDRRRVRLANTALQTGAVTLAHLRSDS